MKGTKTMNKKTFEHFKNHLLRKAAAVRAAKESEYFSEEDLLSNFRSIAAFRKKETPVMIMDLGSKSLDSISTMINAEFDTDDLAINLFTQDQWDEKFVDGINYLIKLYAAVREARE